MNVRQILDISGETDTAELMHSHIDGLTHSPSLLSSIHLHGFRFFFVLSDN